VLLRSDNGILHIELHMQQNYNKVTNTFRQYKEYKKLNTFEEIY